MTLGCAPGAALVGEDTRAGSASAHVLRGRRWNSVPKRR